MPYRFGQPDWMNYMGPNAADVVGYVYRDDMYHPHCILAVLPTGDGQEFDGWALAPGADPMPVEENLREIARAFGIPDDNGDTNVFPVPAFADGEDGDSVCGHCLEPLLDS